MSGPLPEFTANDWALLDDWVDELAAKRRELGDILAAEKRARVRARADSGEATSAGADRYADEMVVDTTADILVLKGEIAALEDKVGFYRDWMLASARGT